MKLEHVGAMLRMGPSFVLYALFLDLGCCPRAHIELDGQFESEEKQSVGNHILQIYCPTV